MGEIFAKAKQPQKEPLGEKKRTNQANKKLENTQTACSPSPLGELVKSMTINSLGEWLVHRRREGIFHGSSRIRSKAGQRGGKLFLYQDLVNMGVFRGVQVREKGGDRKNFDFLPGSLQTSVSNERNRGNLI